MCLHVVPRVDVVVVVLIRLRQQAVARQYASYISVTRDTPAPAGCSAPHTAVARQLQDASPVHIRHMIAHHLYSCPAAEHFCSIKMSSKSHAPRKLLAYTPIPPPPATPPPAPPPPPSRSGAKLALRPENKSETR